MPTLRRRRTDKSPGAVWRRRIGEAIEQPAWFYLPLSAGLSQTHYLLLLPVYWPSGLLIFILFVLSASLEEDLHVP